MIDKRIFEFTLRLVFHPHFPLFFARPRVDRNGFPCFGVSSSQVFGVAAALVGITKHAIIGQPTMDLLKEQLFRGGVQVVDRNAGQDKVKRTFRVLELPEVSLATLKVLVVVDARSADLQ